MVRKLAISLLLIAITVFAFASIGGGRNNAKSVVLKPNFSPLRTSKGFTLKAGPNYRGSIILQEERISDYVVYKSLITYQKGNITYILPNKYKVSLQPNNAKSSLQTLNLRIRLCK